MALRTAGTRPRRFPSHDEVWWQRPDNIIICLTFVAAVVVATTFHLPPKTPPLTIVNGSALTISLDVRPADSQGWMGLGSVPPGHTTLHEVIDQGDSWLVRARAGSHVAAPFAVSRRHMVDRQWKLVVPAQVAASLRSDGAVPEP